MGLAPGTSIGHYNVTSLLGEGGMGQVWQATDTQLNREVALKILPDAFAADPDRLARFTREAQILASLNHPNIAAIHGIEESEGTRALVLELVEGPTLADRISKGPIPLDEALPIAKQIAEALEAAHEAGVIHRDLKPANIKVREDGTVKVLDFGLAKALAGDEQGADLSQSPTVTAAGTQQGVILGTAAYMSPEQARGKPLDKRTDIWSFGCVLYEVLTGRAAFLGETLSDTLGKILERAPDYGLLPPDTPAVVETLLSCCLEKNTKKRVRDIGDALLAMDGAFDTRAPASSDRPMLSATQRAEPWRRLLPWAVAGLAVIGTVMMWSRGPASPSQPAAHFAIPANGQLPVQTGRLMAVSPDGRDVVYVAVTEDGDQLYRRPLNQLASVPIPGTEGARAPFFSPDGQSLGFNAPDGRLRKVSLAGGLPTTLCDCGARAFFNGVWGTDGTIVYTDGDTRGLMRVSSAGGVPEPLTTLEDGDGVEVRHDEPAFLSNGTAVLFHIWSGSQDTAQLAVVSLQTGETRLLGDGFSPLYAPTGHLVYAQAGGSLWAVPFDADQLEVTGDPVPVLEGVRIEVGGAVQFTFADNGSAVYIARGMSRGNRMLVWVDREGREEPLSVEAGAYGAVQISPDGTRVALRVEGRQAARDLWVYDLVRDRTTQLTFDAAMDTPVWTPDGQRIIFRSTREGEQGLLWKAADGTGQLERLTTSASNQVPWSMTPDGQTLAYSEQNSATGWDIAYLSLGDEPHSQTLVASAFVDAHPRISPDGRWMAYESDESGQLGIYVRPFPNVDDGKWRVSGDGAWQPVWSPDGRELFYREGNALLAVSIETTPAFAAGNPRVLFSGPYRRPGPNGQVYDIAPDGERFLMIRETEVDTGESEMIVLQDWFQNLTERVPVN